MLPRESAPWVENSPSRSLDQDSASSVARSWSSETVAAKATASPSLTVSPVVGELSSSSGGVPTV